MAIDFDNPVTAGTVLVRSAIQSPNYSAGAAGWTVNINGSAEFNNLTIRGTFFGTSYVLNTSGAFFYNGTPAAGNLVLSIASAAGTDAFANAYVRGLGTYAATVNTYQLDSTTGNVSIGPGAAAHWLFDVAGAKLSLFDQNALLTALLEAFSTNSAFFWLANAAHQFFSFTDGAFSMGTLATPGAIPTAQEQINAAEIGLVTGTAPALRFTPLVNTTGNGSVSGIMQLQSGNPGGLLPGSTSNAKLVLSSQGGSAGMDIELFRGALYRGDLGGWQTPTYNTNWLPSTTFNLSTGNIPLQYCIDGEDNLFIGGCFKAGGTLPGAVAFTLGTTYAPINGNLWVDATRNNAAVLTRFQIQISGGNFNVVAAGGGGIAVGNEYWVPFQKVPLGHLP